MKMLYFIRHAKSSWDDLSLPDIERPLNSRGRRVAPRMAEHLRGLNQIPGLLLTSPALRAFQTASFFADCFRIPEDRFIKDSSVYGGEPEDYLEALRKLNDDFASVAIFGHNPTMEAIAWEVLGRHVHFPTAAVLICRTKLEKWSLLDIHRLEFLDLLIPKELGL